MYFEYFLFLAQDLLYPFASLSIVYIKDKHHEPQQHDTNKITPESLVPHNFLWKKNIFHPLHTCSDDIRLHRVFALLGIDYFLISPYRLYKFTNTFIQK